MKQDKYGMKPSSSARDCYRGLEDITNRLASYIVTLYTHSPWYSPYTSSFSFMKVGLWDVHLSQAICI